MTKDKAVGKTNPKFKKMMSSSILRKGIRQGAFFYDTASVVYFPPYCGHVPVEGRGPGCSKTFALKKRKSSSDLETVNGNDVYPLFVKMMVLLINKYQLYDIMHEKNSIESIGFVCI